MASVEFKQQPPSGLLYNVPSSQSDYIVSTRFQEFLSDSTSAYSPGQIIRFTINSADSVLDGRNSFYRFQLNPSFGTTVNSPRIDLGGIHAMINTHRILLSNGTEIERLDSYNKLYAVARRYMLDESYVKNLEASYSQDSQNDLWYRQDSFELPSAAEAKYVAASGAVTTIASIDVRQYIDVGDYVEVVGAAASAGASGTVIATAAGGFTLDVAGLADIAVAGISRIIVWKKYKSERAIITNQQGVDQYGQTLSTAGFALTNNAINVMFKPFSDFWNNAKMIPLMFMRNLTFEITLEYPNLCFYQESAVAGYANSASTTYFTYTVSNCRMIACLRQPSESMKNVLLNMYNSPQGIPIAFNSFWHNTNTITSTGSVQLVIPVRVKSARGVVSAWYYPYSESNEQLAQQYKSISTTPKNGTTGYQYIIGSQRFPAYAEVNTDGVLNGEAMHHAMSVQNALGVPNHPTSLNRYDFNATNTFPAGCYATSGAVRTKNESKAFIMAINTSSSDVISCGADLTSNQLQLQISRTGGYNGSNVLRSWVLHDRLLLISSANTVVVY